MLEKIKTKYYVTENVKIDVNKFISKNPLLLSRFIKNPSSKSENFEMPTKSYLDNVTPRTDQVPIHTSENSKRQE